MVTIDTYLNGKKLAVAGDENLRLLMGSVNIFKRAENEHEMNIRLAGVTNEKGHISWLEEAKLENGDSITFKVGSSESPTAPVRIIEPKDEEEIGILEWTRAKSIYETHRHRFEKSEE